MAGADPLGTGVPEQPVPEGDAAETIAPTEHAPVTVTHEVDEGDMFDPLGT